MADAAASGVSGAAPRGRRRGSPDTRSAILGAARARFASHGYARTTIRAVAADAGVDAALVHHYFGTKDELFVAALELPVDPRVALGPVIEAGPADAGAGLLRVLLSVWDDPELRQPFLAVVRSFLDPTTQRLVTDGFLPVVITPLGVALGVDRPEHRMPLVASQVVGLILTRYVLELEPLASMSRDDVVATFGPTIQRYLTGDLP